MKSKIKIFKDKIILKLSKQMSDLASKMIVEFIKFLENNEEEFTIKINRCHICKKNHKVQAKIKWNEDAKKIIGKINALKPNPGPWFEIKQF